MKQTPVEKGNFHKNIRKRENFILTRVEQTLRWFGILPDQKYFKQNNDRRDRRKLVEQNEKSEGAKIVQTLHEHSE